MKKYVLTVRTEELRGRMSASREISCYTLAEAERVMEREYDAIARRNELLTDEDIDDRTRVLEYVPRMRTTLAISEA